MSKSVMHMDESEVTAHISSLAAQLGIAPEEGFDSLTAARIYARQLEEQVSGFSQTQSEGNTMNDEVQGAPFDGGQAPAADAAANEATDRSKYDTSGRRGPNLGTGAYAKQRIREGADNKTILDEIREKFPEAKTSMASIAFYRNRLKHENDDSPDELRAKADKLEAEATALREKANQLEAEAAEVAADPADPAAPAEAAA